MSDPHFPPQVRRHAFRIAAPRRRALYATFGVLLASGVIWLATHFLAEDPATQATLEGWSMKFHGAAAWIVTYLLGTIWAAHIRLAWAMKHNRRAGTAFGIMVMLLLVSGYGLYYFNGETLRGLTEWLHWAVGMLAGLVFWLHLSLGRRYGAASPKRTPELARDRRP